MTDTYTPTTEEVKEVWCTPMTMSAAINEEAHWEAEDQFDRWLTAHDAEVAAKALEEAAVGIFVRPASADAVYDALRARAAKYRKAVQ